jgi:hypothetical protein
MPGVRAEAIAMGKIVACDFGQTDEQKRKKNLCARSKIKK